VHLPLDTKKEISLALRLLHEETLSHTPGQPDHGVIVLFLSVGVGRRSRGG
jgi:hypothetical protein